MIPGAAPVGASPVAAGSESLTVAPSVTADADSSMTGADALLGNFMRTGDAGDVVAAADAAVNVAWPSLRDALVAGDAAAGEALANLVSRMIARTSITPAFTLQAAATDTVRFEDAVVAVWELLLADQVATVGEASTNVRRLAAIVDAVAATGQVQANMQALAAAISAIALEGLVAQGFQADAVDAVLLNETCAAVARVIGPLVDALQVSDAGVPMARVSVVCAEHVTIDASPAALLRANADASDQVVIYVNLRLGDTDYTGWALNTALKAVTEYRGMPFDAYASYRGRHYAAGEHGLVRLQGPTDDGAPIEAWLRTGLLNFGTDKLKRVPDAFIGAASDGGLVLKTVTTDPMTGRRVEDWYRVTQAPANAPTNGVVKPGRGLKSVWWQFELHNAQGSDFALDNIVLRPLYLDRRT